MIRHDKNSKVNDIKAWCFNLTAREISFHGRHDEKETDEEEDGKGGEEERDTEQIAPWRSSRTDASGSRSSCALRASRLNLAK